MSFPTPGGDLTGTYDRRPLRYDLDDLNGEICLLDWGEDGHPEVSLPNRHLPSFKLMKDGCINLVKVYEGKDELEVGPLHHRMTLLDPQDHEFMKALPKDYKDPIAQDIKDSELCYCSLSHQSLFYFVLTLFCSLVPRVCRDIQDDWRGFGTGSSLNRLTAWNLAKCLQRRMESLLSQSVERQAGTIDILLTGCEVSLWLAEQFASDLQKALPRLRIVAVSSNKLLGLFGQDMNCPSIGFPYSQQSNDLKGSIMIIVSHSGGTFAPLACSNLLQSFSDNIFVVASEWDTQS